MAAQLLVRGRLSTYSQAAAAALYSRDQLTDAQCKTNHKKYICHAKKDSIYKYLPNLSESNHVKLSYVYFSPSKEYKHQSSLSHPFPFLCCMSGQKSSSMDQIKSWTPQLRMEGPTLSVTKQQPIKSLVTNIILFGNHIYFFSFIHIQNKYFK